MTFAEGADFFGQRGAQFADNVRNYYQLLPRPRPVPDPRHRQSADRSLEGLARAGRRVRPSRRGRGDQGRPDRARRQDARDPRPDRRRASGLSAARHPRRRGALRARLRHSVRDARACASSAASRSTTARRSLWDHPLGARFEEPDAVCVFDDVLIPWERVFLYGDVKMGNALFAQASIRNHTGHQTAIRGLAKMPVPHRHRGRADAHGEVRRVPARAGAARRTARLSAN